MKNTILSLLVIACFIPHLQAQSGMGIDIGAGIASYQLEDLKSIQQVLLDDFPVDGQITNLFPPYFLFRTNLFKPLNDRVRLGINFQYGSTGARASYEDYSGRITADQVLTMYQLGGNVAYRLLYSNYFEVLAYGSLMGGLTNDNITREIYISGYGGIYEYLDLRAISPLFEPGIEILYHRNDRSFGIDAGYQFDMGGNFRIKGEGDYFYSPLNDQVPVRTGISGFRASVKFILWFRDQYDYNEY